MLHPNDEVAPNIGARAGVVCVVRNVYGQAITVRFADGVERVYDRSEIDVVRRIEQVDCKAYKY